MSVITFKSVTSTSKDVTVLKYPDIVKPTLRVETVKVPGRDGELTLYSIPSYEAIVLECECAVPSVDKISAAAAWLTGSGDLILGNDSTYAYDAQIIDEIRFEKILRGHGHRRFVVPFLCHPLKKKASTEADIELTSSGTVANIGHVSSRPLIKIEGSGNVTLAVGSYALTITGISTSILIDSDLGIATNAAKTANESYKVSGAWPLLVVGNNAVSWTGTVSKVTITPRWRYL
jgi:phage-related protein